MSSSKNPPQTPKIANNPNMAYRYGRAYESLFSKLPPPVQQRALAVKLNPNIKDSDVDAFIIDVIGLAESDKEL